MANLAKIKNLKELIKFASRPDGVECFICLNYGVRSSKKINYDKGDKKPFKIWNLIDDSEIELTEKQMMNKNYTLIGEAMKFGSLIREN